MVSLVNNPSTETVQFTDTEPDVEDAGGVFSAKEVTEPKVPFTSAVVQAAWTQ
ncbi:Spore coat U domain protein [Yersinia ruckeri ATCC 29473]|nr:Spore coat U domain protein [Yersinia ruckeri ATCC 29473]